MDANVIENFENWLHKTNLSTKTIEYYKGLILLYFKKNSEISKASIWKYLSSLEKIGRSPSYYNSNVNAFKKFCDFQQNGIVIRHIKVPRMLHLDGIPCEEKYFKLLDYLKQIKNYEYYLWVKVLSCTGARIGEFMQFTWEDIIAGEFMVKGKGGKYRFFFIPKNLSDEISDYALRHGKSGYFAKNKFGQRISQKGIRDNMCLWAKKLDFPPGMLHPHAFRHFFAKQYLKHSQNDIAQLAELMGHSSLDTTRIYLMKSKEEQRRDYNVVVKW